MRSRWLLSLLLLGLAVLPVPAQQKDQPAKSDPPALMIRLAPIEELVADAQYVASFTEFEERAKQFAKTIEGAGKNGLYGIDTKKPIGAYVYLKENLPESQAILMVPIANEEAFLDTLNSFNAKPEKDKDGVYTVQLPQVPVPALFRFANGYCYITAQNKDAIAKDKLANPAQVLPAGQGALTTVFRIDQIPETFRQIALQQIEVRMKEALKQVPEGQTKAQKAFAEQLQVEFFTLVKDVVSNGQEVALKLDVDRKTHKLLVELSLGGKPDSKLSGLFSRLGKSESVFGSFSGGDSAFLMLLHLAMPQDLLKPFSALVDDTMAQALKDQTDDKRKAQAEKVLKALEPTLKAGEVDVTFDMRRAAKGDLYTLVVGGKVKDGAALDKTLHDMIKELPTDDQKRIKLDAEQAGGVKIHMIDTKGLDDKGKKTFGEGPAYFAVRDDAVVAVIGDNALSTIKEVLAAKPKASPQAKVSVGLQALVPAMAQAPNADPKALEKAAREAFGKDKDADKIALVVEGGQALKIRFEMGAPAIKFFDLVRQAAK